MAQEKYNDFTKMNYPYIQGFKELSELPATHTKICAKLLRDHTELRVLELRAGATLKGLEKGKANLEASLAYLRGELQVPECIHCSEKKAGPFRRCVVVKDFFGGSCTNCRYNEEQTRCSLRGAYWISLMLRVLADRV